MSFFKCCVVLTLAVLANCSPAAKIDAIDSFKLSDRPELKGHESNEVTGRTDSIEDSVSQYLQGYNATFALPILGSTVTLEGKNLDQDELDVKLKFSDPTEVQARKKKSKLKKIFVPLFIIMLIKVITLIPLALGVLGLKTWNALQLSFITFVVSIAMAVYQLCTKLNADHPPITAHGPWDPHHARSFDDAQKMAYSAYTQ